MRIESIDTRVVTYPTAGHFKFFDNPPGLPDGRRTVLVKITTDDGAIGWGQAVPSPRWSYETVESVRSTIRLYLAPVLLGADPRDMESLQAALDRAIAPSFSRGQPICKAAIDLALCDLLARRESQSLAAQWGRSAEQPVTLSWTLNPRTLDEAEQSIDEAHRRGFRHFNIKVAPNFKFDLELIQLARRMAGDGVLWADANGGYDRATASAAAVRFADFGLIAFEQPVAANCLSGLAELRRIAALPIVLDEPIVTTTDLRELHQLGLLDGVAVKVARCGGLTEARRQVEYLLEHDLMFLGSGLTDPDVSLAASAILFSAYELPYPAALNGPQFLTDSVLQQPLDVAGDQLHVPQGPGLGVAVDETRLRELSEA